MKTRNSIPMVNGHASNSAAAHVARGAEAERERVRDAMHNGVGQLLTSISFLANSLRQKLAEQNLPEAREAAEILTLTGRAINEAQLLVREDTPLGHAPKRRTGTNVASNLLD